MNELDIIYDEGKAARTYTMETDQGKLISIVPLPTTLSHSKLAKRFFSQSHKQWIQKRYPDL